MSTERGLPGAGGPARVGLGRAPHAAPEAGHAVLLVEREGGDASPTTYPLERGRYVVGRHEHCDVQISDRDLSRRHAAFERDAEGRWCVVDLGGASGTFVNGRQLEAERPRRLGPGDVVHVGTWRLRVRSGEPAAPIASLLPPDGQRTRPDPARIRIYDGAFADREIRLDRGEVIIGAVVDATIPLDPARYAGIRIVIRPRKDGAFDVRDESEAESLSVNGRPLAEYTLGRSDVVLRIGPMEVQRRDAHEAFTVRYMPSRRRPGQETPPVDPGGRGEAPPAAGAPEGERATRPMRTLSAGAGAPPPAPWADDTAPLRGSVQHDTAPFPAMPAPAWLAGDTLSGAPLSAEAPAVDSVRPADASEERAPARGADAAEPFDVDVAVGPEPVAHRAAQPHAAAHDTERLAALPFPLPAAEAFSDAPSAPGGGESLPLATPIASDGAAESFAPPTAPARAVDRVAHERDGSPHALRNDAQPERAAESEVALDRARGEGRVDGSAAARPTWRGLGATLGAVVAASALAAWWLWPRVPAPDTRAPAAATSVTTTMPAPGVKPSAAPAASPAAPAPSASAPRAPAAPAAPPRSVAPRPPVALPAFRTPRPSPSPSPSATGEPPARPQPEDDGSEGKAAFCRTLAARLASGGAPADVQRMFDQRCR